MTDGAALLKAILANRDDDTPRLVYADWLQENGQGERAEFIRVGCDAARAKCGHSLCDPVSECAGCQLRIRERGLLYAPEIDGVPCNGYRWSEPLHELGIQVGSWDYRPETFWRGFLACLEMTADHWIAHCDAILAQHPIQRVKLTTVPIVRVRRAASGLYEFRIEGRERWHHMQWMAMYVHAACEAEWPRIAIEIADPSAAFRRPDYQPAPPPLEPSHATE